MLCLYSKFIFPGRWEGIRFIERLNEDSLHPVVEVISNDEAIASWLTETSQEEVCGVMYSHYQ